MTKHKIVREAYLFGYPLVTMDMTRRHETNVRVPDDAHAPMGQLVKLRAYPAVDDHGAAAPNADTLYTMAWLDVSAGPWVFSIPDMGDRFYIMPMLSGFNEVFFVAGSRATGGKAQEYVITGPGWSGTLPEGVTHVESPTALVWILGRVYCEGTPEDYKAVHELQDQFSSFLSAPTASPTRRRQAWWTRRSTWSKDVRAGQPPSPRRATSPSRGAAEGQPAPSRRDAPIVGRMAKIGIVPGGLRHGKLPAGARARSSGAAGAGRAMKARSRSTAG